HRTSWREFILGMGLHTTEEMESAGFGDFLGATSSFTSIRDLTCRLCYRLTAWNIAGRSQALEKVFEDVYFEEEHGICEELDDTLAWVAPGPERQPDAAAGASVFIEGALDVDEGA
nr:hypothetical protein [Tanacetum cinerariifolium]